MTVSDRSRCEAEGPSQSLRSASLDGFGAIYRIIPGDVDRGSTAEASAREDAMRLAALVLICAALSIRSIALPTAAAPMPLQRARQLQESLDAALSAIVSSSDGGGSGSGAVAADAAELLLRHAAGPLADALISHAKGSGPSPSSSGGGSSSSMKKNSSRIPPRKAGASSSPSSSSGGPWGAQQLELQHPAARAVIEACMRAMRVLPRSSSSSFSSSSSPSSGPSSSSSGKSSSFQPALMEEIQAGVRLLVEQQSSSSFPLVRWAGSKGWSCGLFVRLCVKCGCMWRCSRGLSLTLLAGQVDARGREG